MKKEKLKLRTDRPYVVRESIEEYDIKTKKYSDIFITITAKVLSESNGCYKVEYGFSRCNSNDQKVNKVGVEIALMNPIKLLPKFINEYVTDHNEVLNQMRKLHKFISLIGTKNFITYFRNNEKEYCIHKLLNDYLKAYEYSESEINNVNLILSLK